MSNLKSNSLSPPPTPQDTNEVNDSNKRPRSRMGCFTCRKRKKRCDEARPLCVACSRLGLECKYPQPGTERKNKRRRSTSKARKSEPSKSTSTDITTLAEANIDNVISTSPSTFISNFSNPMDHIFGPFETYNDVVLPTVPENENSRGLAQAMTIPQSPTSWTSLQLDSIGNQLLDYFRDRLAKMICVSTEDSNSFLNVFVPMAHDDNAVLYALVAWAGFHKDRGQMQDTALRYLNRAIQNVKQNDSCTSLASMLLICSAEICSGDVMHWDKHLTAAANMIKMHGGIEKFLSDTRLRWLASNFAYHDLLASSTCARNTHFPSKDYDKIMKHGFGLDALIGCCQPLFKILAEISDLAVDSQSSQQTPEYLRLIRSRAQELEQKIASCHPDPLDMITLSSDQLEEQLTLFEVFQVTAQLHLRQAVLVMNAASVDLQVLCHELTKKLDNVLETCVEGGLVFPLFIAGVNTVGVEARELMSIRFERYYERNLARNIKRARHLMEEVWNRDDNGTRYVDWYGIIQSRGWDICFA